MKTVFVLLSCVFGLQLCACMRTAEPVRAVQVPSRLAATGTSAPPSPLILGVN